MFPQIKSAVSSTRKFIGGVLKPYGKELKLPWFSSVLGDYPSDIISHVAVLCGEVNIGLLLFTGFLF